MKVAVSGIVCSLTYSAVCGEFGNLTFDRADFSRLAVDANTGALSAPIEDMLPGWEVSLRPRLGVWQPYTGLVELSNGIGGSPAALSTLFAYGSSGYGVSMQAIPAIGFPVRPDPPDVRLSTKGAVPSNALTFDWYEGRGFELTISDGFRTVTAVGNSGPISVSQFAGKEVTISFLQRSGSAGGVDVIGFSLVPEPETWALLGIGMVGLCVWRQCKMA